MQTSYTKEFKLIFWKDFFAPFLSCLVLISSFGCLLPFIHKGMFTAKTILGPAVALCFLIVLASILGYLRTHKKIIFIYNDETIHLLFKGGWHNVSKNKEFSINVSEVSEYKEECITNSKGYLQFIMKDNSVIQIAYSGHLDMYRKMRQEILHILNSKNIKTTCNF